MADCTKNQLCTYNVSYGLRAVHVECMYCSISIGICLNTHLCPFTCHPLPTTAVGKALGAFHWLQTRDTECTVHPLPMNADTVDTSRLVARPTCCAALYNGMEHRMS